MKRPDAQDIREVLSYDVGTGRLTWKHRDTKRFKSEKDSRKWNARFAGKPAFTALNSDGYLCGSVLGYKTTAHRVIFAIVTGSWPTFHIDHIDHDRVNNRWKNLRGVTNQQNCRNRLLPSNNVSGQVGVHWEKKAGKWRATIHDGSSQISLGFYSDFFDAVAARKAKESELGFHRNHGQRQ